MLAIIKNFCGDESGATAIEYGLIVALLAVALIGALGSLGTSLSGFFNSTSNVVVSKTPS